MTPRFFAPLVSPYAFLRRWHRRTVVCSAAIAALLPGLAPTVLATEPTRGQATGVVPFANHTQSLVRTSDGNATFTAVDLLTLSGDISGQATDTYTFTIHPNGSITGHGIETCSACTIAGRTGGYSQVFNFTATPNFATFQGRFAFTTATGDLVGLHGEGTFEGSAGATGFTETVVLNFHFEP